MLSLAHREFYGILVVPCAIANAKYSSLAPRRILEAVGSEVHMNDMIGNIHVRFDKGVSSHALHSLRCMIILSITEMRSVSLPFSES